MNILVTGHRGFIGTNLFPKLQSRFSDNIIGLDIKDGKVLRFGEKSQSDAGWINGGFFVCQPEVLDYITNDDSIWEKESLEQLAGNGELTAFKHRGFWKPMDSMRDHKQLNDIWDGGNAPWKIW